MGLTVTEKEHWKNRLEARIDKEIERLWATADGLRPRLQEQAHEQALEQLGIAKYQAQLEELEQRIEALVKEKDAIADKMYAEALNVPLSEVERTYRTSSWERDSRIQEAVSKREAIIYEQLLRDDPSLTGAKVMKLEDEKERLLDVVWLATGSKQIKELWAEVSSVLGDEDSELVSRSLKIAPEEAA